MGERSDFMTHRRENIVTAEIAAGPAAA